MAHPSDAVFEVRTTGAGDNGGGFSASLAGVGGVDYSQQDAPELSLIDATFSSASTSVTSTGGGFTEEMVGNAITFSDGITFFGHRFITAFVDTNEVTIDSNAPGSDTGDGIVKVGGASLVDVNGLIFQPVDGNKVWWQAGTYPISGNDVEIATGSVGNSVTIEGYTSVRGDITAGTAATRPVLDWSSGSFAPLNLNANGAIVRNLEIDNTGNGDDAVLVQGNNCLIENCKIIAGASGRGLDVSGNQCILRRNWIIAGATASDAVYLAGTVGGHVLENNYIVTTPGNTMSGIAMAIGGHFLRGNVIRDFTFGAILHSTGVDLAVVENNIFYNNTHGVVVTNAEQGVAGLLIRSNIFEGNTNAIRYDPSDISANPGAIQWALIAFDCNHFYDNTTDYSQLPEGANNTALTASPFTDPTTADFSLNSVAGGGAVVRATGCEAAFASGLPAANTASIIAGPYGNLAPVVSAPTQTMIDLWREYTGEFDGDDADDPVPPATVYKYLNGGLEATNRRIGYYLATSTTLITLVDGTQEYTLDDDVIELVWVHWNGRFLPKGDVAQWDRDNAQWRNEKRGPPQQWAHEGDRLIFRPMPDAAAVATQSAPTIRHVAKPPPIETDGPDQLASQDYRVAVYFGVAEWSAAHPDSVLARERKSDFMGKFDTEIAAIAAKYARRRLSR